MYEIEFYKSQNGNIPVRDYIRDVRKKYGDSEVNKIRLFMDLLKNHGMAVNNIRNFTIRPFSGGLYELRPGDNRIFFFYFEDTKFVFLHAYRKQKQEAPLHEIKTAKKRMNDYKRRFE